MTDWSTPLLWSAWGTFYPAAGLKRGKTSSTVGFEVQTMDFEWSPDNFDFTQDIATTSPYQAAWLGRYDGVKFRSWTCYMPFPGDADTLGAAELFGGRVGDISTERNKIKLTVNSFLDVVNQMVPGSVIEVLNTIAGFKGATPPAGLTQVPTFVVTSAAQGQINADCTSPTPGQIFSTDAFEGGFLQMTSGALSGMWTSIATNTGVSGPHNAFTLFQKFPWPPIAGDTFYASATFPINQADGQYFGFPYVPDPSTAI